MQHSKNVLIVGGAGGIGREVVIRMLEDPKVDKVYATYHNAPPKLQHEKLTWYRLDCTKESEFHELSMSIASHNNTLDWVVNCVGVLHGEGFSPEKNVMNINGESFIKIMSVNALATLLLAKYLQPLIRRSLEPRFVAISAKVGSISDNRLGGWYSYRCSKAALNMAVKNLSIEWQRIMPNVAVVAFHPGTTNTTLSAPFQARVAPEKLFEPEYLAKVIGTLLHRLSPNDNGRFIAYNQDTLPW
jgi:NAD(P)-dependent dehydrogenase (short-subunit alcohol dehydrogenase family)